MSRPLVVLIRCAAIAGAAGLIAGCGDDEPGRATAAPSCVERPPIGNGSEPGETLECLRLPRRLVPEGAEAAAWTLGARRFAVVWRTYGSGSGLAVWRRARDGSYDRLLERRRATAIDYGISLDDVTGDGRIDLLANESSGSGGCGARVAFRVGTARATPLFRRRTCELHAELRDGLLWFREPLGECPGRRAGIHCHGGVRITVRGWAGDRLVVSRTIVRCRWKALDESRGCRPR